MDCIPVFIHKQTKLKILSCYEGLDRPNLASFIAVVRHSRHTLIEDT